MAAPIRINTKAHLDELKSSAADTWGIGQRGYTRIQPVSQMTMNPDTGSIVHVAGDKSHESLDALVMLYVARGGKYWYSQVTGELASAFERCGYTVIPGLNSKGEPDGGTLAPFGAERKAVPTPLRPRGVGVAAAPLPVPAAKPAPLSPFDMLR